MHGGSQVCVILIVRLLTLVVCVAGVLAAGPLSAADQAEKPDRFYQDGQKAERAGHMVRAYLLYSQAAALDPANPIYSLKAQAVQARAALESPPRGPEPEKTPETAAAADPSSAFDSLSSQDRAAERHPQPPPELRAAPGSKDFAMRADAKSLWQQVAHAFGLETVFDRDYKSGPPVRFELNQADYRDAIHALEAATDSFVVPISHRLFLVVTDTEQKRRELEPMVAVNIPVPQVLSGQELVEIAQSVRQVFTLEHVAWDASAGAVVIRDRISRVTPAKLVFEELLHGRPQVLIEMELLQIDLTNSLAYGIDVAPTFPLAYLGTFWQSPVSIPSSITKMLTFGGGQSLIGIGIQDAAAMATMTQSTARTLARASVRALDGLPATLHVGQKYPILTSGYFGPSSFSSGGQAYTPPPSFTFEDLGMSMKVTPHVHGNDEVTLDVESEFAVLGSSSVNGIPVISNRKLTSSVRLREGEWGVISGLLNTSEARTLSGTPGLSMIPILGELFRQTTKDTNTTEVLVIIKPTLLTLSRDQFATPTIWTGPDARPRTIL